MLHFEQPVEVPQTATKEAIVLDADGTPVVQTASCFQHSRSDRRSRRLTEMLRDSSVERLWMRSCDADTNIR